MKRFHPSTLLAGVLLFSATAPLAHAATLVFQDDFTVANTNSGFALGEGLNSGINPPDNTRLKGTAAANLRYMRTGSKGDAPYTIASGKANITKGSQSGRFTISADGTTPFNFGPALGIDSATPEKPSVYDVTISLNNKGTTGRLSFALGTVESAAGTWNFGVQIFKSGTAYNIYKRIKSSASGLAGELNSVIATTGTAGTEINFLLRVTDAGAESTSYNSRLQLSIDGGATWIYDTMFDTDLPNGWRFESATRYFSFDQAINDGLDTYDNFSVTLQNESTEPTQPNLGIQLNNSDATIRFQGKVGQKYILQSSQDLQTWINVNTNTAAGDGLMQFFEPISSNPIFYRTRTE